MTGQGPAPEPGESAARAAEAVGLARTDTSRVEAFSDAVMAIAITILALEMRMPEHAPGRLLPALVGQWPVYLGYLISFAYTPADHQPDRVDLRHRVVAATGHQGA